MHKPYFNDNDRSKFFQAAHYAAYDKMGARPRKVGGVEGVQFVLWAPNARAVSVVHDANGWTPGQDNMENHGGIWELFIPNMPVGAHYKYHVVQADGRGVMKADPYAYQCQLRPDTASIVTDLRGYRWHDKKFLDQQTPDGFKQKPMAVYEVHLGSWKRNPDGSFWTYRDLAHGIADYVLDMGYTHVELMGICEYPFDPSWGYQVTGYYAPTSRYGEPKDFMYFVDYLHRKGIGVILDWVPAHFPKDEYGLALFDGTPMYEYADPLRAEYPQWGTKSFDLARPEVISFLISSAMFWIKKYHVDALRVDAVAAMMFNNFCREEWRPNAYGGEHNLDGFAFFRHLNHVLHEQTNAYLIAEDSSILAGMTKPVSEGGFGFGLKWNMGWMNETIRYLNEEPINRKYHHHLMTHTTEYAFQENYILVLSHDEVVHGKGSMFNKSPGSRVERMGAIKTNYTMMMGHPGKKLLFMGQEFGQESEWGYERELDWPILQDAGHSDIQGCFRKLLHLYREHPVLHDDTNPTGFEWINSGDVQRSIFSFLRRNPWNYDDALLFVCNYTPVAYPDFSVGAPVPGEYQRIFTTRFENSESWSGHTQPGLCDGRENRLPYALDAYESAIFLVPKQK